MNLRKSSCRLGNVKRDRLAAPLCWRMLEYKLFRLDGSTQHIVYARDLLARDDLDALTEAEKFCGAGAIEIWQGARRVARVKKGNAPLNASDRTSL